MEGGCRHGKALAILHFKSVNLGLIAPGPQFIVSTLTVDVLSWPGTFPHEGLWHTAEIMSVPYVVFFFFWSSCTWSVYLFRARDRNAQFVLLSLVTLRFHDAFKVGLSYVAPYILYVAMR